MPIEPVWHPSPNFGTRRPGLIVLHYTVITPTQAAIDWLCDPAKQVSAHYVIGDDGTVYQLVKEDKRAWHAGVSEWQGVADVNALSIGIELVNDGQSPFAEALLVSLERVLGDIMDRHSIPPAGVVGHSDVAPGRKVDPGKYFPWERLAQKKMAVPAGFGTVPDTIDEASFRDAAHQVGYTNDVSYEDLLRAVRLRWRQGASGPLSREDFIAMTRPT